MNEYEQRRPFEHSSERAEVIERLAVDFGFVDAVCRMHWAEGEMAPPFCYQEFNRIWTPIQENRLSWLERLVVYGKLGSVT